MGSFRKFSKIAAIIAVGGVISRWHGSSKGKKVIKNLAWAVPFGALVWFCTGNWVLSGVALGMCLLKAAPTRQYLDLGTFEKVIRKRNTFDYALIPIFGYDPKDPEIPDGARLTPVELLYWRDVAGLSITGLAATSGAVAAFAYIGNASAVVALTVAGLAKGPCYMLGRKLSEKHATLLGELFTGLAAFAGIAYVLALYDLI